MPEVLTCPSCQRKLQVPEALLGQDVQCPTCGATFAAQADGSVPIQRPPREEPPLEEAPLDDRPSSRALTRSSRHDDYDDRPSRPRKRRRSSYEPHRGSLIMVLGILSLIPVMGMPLILGPIAWILGNSDLAAIRAGRMDPEGESQTATGRMMGMIGTLVWGTITLLVITLYAACCVMSIIAGASGAGGGGGRRY
jgi:hypothetical protein